MFKYSVVAVENPEEGLSTELSFENDSIIHQNEQIVFMVEHSPRPFKVMKVTKVDHILFPNLPFDYQLFAVGI